MTGSALLEAHTAELNAAIETLTNHCRNVERISDFEVEIRNAPRPLIPPEAPAEAHRARRSIMANMAKLHTLLAEPVDFLQELARQVSAPPFFRLRWFIPTSKLMVIVSAESVTRLHKLAGRVSSPSLYTTSEQCSPQRCRGAYWGAGNAASSNRTDDCYRWLPS